MDRKSPDPYERLTPSQQRFVDAYISNGGNATQAARTAGYKGNDQTLRDTASTNLTKPDIKAAIKNRAKPDEDKRAADIATVQRRLMEICTQDEDLGAAVKAAAVLAKVLGMEAPKRVETTVTGIVTLPAKAKPEEYEKLRGEIFGGGEK